MARVGCSVGLLLPSLTLLVCALLASLIRTVLEADVGQIMPGVAALPQALLVAGQPAPNGVGVAD